VPDALARQWQVDVLWVDKASRWSATPGLVLKTTMAAIK